jgi:hypothetical protein
LKQKLGVSDYLIWVMKRLTNLQTKNPNLIINATNEEERSQILAILSEGASDWINALPLASLGFELSMLNYQMYLHCANLMNANSIKM